MITEEKKKENRLRRKASLMGLTLCKSRRRDETIHDFGLYGLVDARTNVLTTPALYGMYVYSMTLDQIEEYLTEDEKTLAKKRKAAHRAAHKVVRR